MTTTTNTTNTAAPATPVSFFQSVWVGVRAALPFAATAGVAAGIGYNLGQRAAAQARGVANV